MRLEKAARVALLYDFYGPLLTEKQRQAVEMYYHDDLSLAEVAGELGISRQGVHDLLRRTESALEEYEARLGLVARHSRQRRGLERLQAALAGLEKAADPVAELGRLREMVAELMETLPPGRGERDGLEARD